MLFAFVVDIRIGLAIILEASGRPDPVVRFTSSIERNVGAELVAVPLRRIEIFFCLPISFAVPVLDLNFRKETPVAF